MTVPICRYMKAKIHLILKHKQNEDIHIIQAFISMMYFHIFMAHCDHLKCPK